jgi:hypothetical protein
MSGTLKAGTKQTSATYEGYTYKDLYVNGGLIGDDISECCRTHNTSIEEPMPGRRSRLNKSAQFLTGFSLSKRDNQTRLN